MKKLVKILGLLLVAGALFVGCKQNVDIDADKIELSNGTWDITSEASGAYTQGALSGSIAYISKEAIQVSGDKSTYLSVSQTIKATFDCGSADAAAAAKAGFDEAYAGNENAPSISVSGSKLIMSQTYTADAEDIEEMNKDENLVSEFGYLPEGATLTRNKSKTEYKITYVQKADPDDEDDADMTVTVTIKKRK